MTSAYNCNYGFCYQCIVIYYALTRSHAREPTHDTGRQEPRRRQEQASSQNRKHADARMPPFRVERRHVTRPPAIDGRGALIAVRTSNRPRRQASLYGVGDTLISRPARHREGRTPKRNGCPLRNGVHRFFCLTPCFLGQIWQIYKSLARACGPSIPVAHQKARTAMRTSDFSPLARTSSALRRPSWGDPRRSDLYICHICPIQQGVMD